MLQTALVHDLIFKRHETGPGRPESPARLSAVQRGLERSGAFSSAERIEPREIERELLYRIHAPEYVERLRQACEAGEPIIDTPDSAICPESFEIALLAAGAVVEAARRIGRGEVSRAFCAVRPPGHHAERDVSMGFCLFNNIALAAEALRSEFAAERILILDWDVHHGNATQHTFERDAGVLFISLHGHPDTLYPGTGYAHETGLGAGEGFTLNIPMPPGSGDADYQQAFAEQIEPLVDRFKPTFTLISAGFDAHADDPLGNQRLSTNAYAWMTERALGWARRHGEGRILSVLEGGYNLGALAECVEAHSRTLFEK